MRLTQLRRAGRWVALARVAAIVVGGAMVLSACTSSGGAQQTVTITQDPNVTQVTAPTLTDQPTTTSPAEPARTSDEPTTDPVRVSAIPAFGSTKVGPNDPIVVTAFHGQLSSVTMSGDDGAVINGEITDGASWSPTDPLDYGVTYTVSGTAVDAAGASAPFQGTLATINPKKATLGDAGQSLKPGKNTFLPAYMQIPDGGTVGIAAPIIITFAASVADRAAAERQLKVTVADESGEPIELHGSWGWMQDEQIQANGPKQSRVHFRPKDYWPARAQVHVEANLKGVNYGSGWGSQNIVRDFTIGDNMVIKADVDSHRLLVLIDDAIVKNYPVSYGLPSDKDPGRTTVSGIHIVQDKKPGEFEMCNRKYNYCNSKQYWGVRINNNGEFIHVNKQTEASGLLGKANVSHGCINMGMRDGEEFFNMVYYGVPVDVEGTGVQMGYGDYVWDWAVSWEDWKSFSAL